MLETLFFVIVSLIAIVSAILVVTCRNPINSALSLILTFFCLATYYVMLDAPFMAAVQVMVYAGAIMVLIVFTIMLLNIRVNASKSHTHKVLLGLVIGFFPDRRSSPNPAPPPWRRRCCRSAIAAHRLSPCAPRSANRSTGHRR